MGVFKCYLIFDTIPASTGTAKENATEIIQTVKFGFTSAKTVLSIGM